MEKCRHDFHIKLFRGTHIPGPKQTMHETGRWSWKGFMEDCIHFQRKPCGKVKGHHPYWVTTVFIVVSIAVVRLNEMK